jgi:hypothetical protein
MFSSFEACAGYLGHPFAKSVVFYEWMSQVASTGNSNILLMGLNHYI